jgi:hypothetical protein
VIRDVLRLFLLHVQLKLYRSATAGPTHDVRDEAVLFAADVSAQEGLEPRQLGRIDLPSMRTDDCTDKVARQLFGSWDRHCANLAAVFLDAYHHDDTPAGT